MKTIKTTKGSVKMALETNKYLYNNKYNAVEVNGENIGFILINEKFLSSNQILLPKRITEENCKRLSEKINCLVHDDK